MLVTKSQSLKRKLTNVSLTDFAYMILSGSNPATFILFAFCALDHYHGPTSVSLMQKYRTMKTLLGSNNIEVISRYETAMRHIFLQKSKNSELILDGEEAVLS